MLRGDERRLQQAVEHVLANPDDLMRIDVHLHSPDADSTNSKLDAILKLLNQILAKETKLMATLDETLAKVTEESTVDDSIIALLTAIKAQLDAGGLSPDAQAKVDAIFGGLQANIDKVTAAVTANTPAAPTP